MVGLFIISVAAELTGVHPQTLRTYEKKGLINPKRTSGGTRRYTQEDVERVLLIQHLTQEEGINLAGVMRILELSDKIDYLEEELAEAHRQVEYAKKQMARAIREGNRHNSTDIVIWQPPAIEPARRISPRHR